MAGASLFQLHQVFSNQVLFYFVLKKKIEVERNAVKKMEPGKGL